LSDTLTNKHNGRFKDAFETNGIKLLHYLTVSVNVKAG
jgi:ribosomal protein S17E